MRIARAVACLAGLMVLAATIGCSSTTESPPDRSRSEEWADQARPLTSEEAQRLSLVRFRNFDAGGRRVGFSVEDGGLQYDVASVVDFQSARGYGTVSDPAGTEHLLLVWDQQVVATRPWDSVTGPAVPPPDGWTTSALTPEASRLHTVMAVALTLGLDRPDNSLLLQQSDARWLHAQELTVGGETVATDVIAGPTADEVFDPAVHADDGSEATIRYWVDETGTAHRIEIRPGAGGAWVRVELGESTPTTDLEALLADLGGHRDG